MGNKPDEIKGLPTEAAAAGLLAVIAAALPLVFTPALSDSFYLPKLTLLAGFVIVALATLAGGRILSGPLPGLRGIVFRPLDIAVIAFAVIAVLSTLTAASPALSFMGRYRTPEGLFSILAYIGLYFAASRITWTKSRLRLLFSTALAGGLLVTSYAFIQAAGLDFAYWKDIPYSSDRFGSSLGNPIMLAGYVAIAGFAFISLAALFEKPWIRISILTLSSFVVAGSLMLASGRAGIIGLGAGLIAAAVLARRAKGGVPNGVTTAPKQLFLLIGIVLIVGTAFAAAAGYVNAHGGVNDTEESTSPQAAEVTAAATGRESKFDDTSARDRINIWLSSPRLIHDRAATGWGPDSFQLIYPTYQSLASAQIESANGELGRRAEDAHNIVLQTAATLGLPGLAAFFFLVAMIFYEGNLVLTGKSTAARFTKSSPEKTPPPVIAAFLLAGVTAFLFSSLLTPVVSGAFIFFWLFAGILSSLSRRPLAAAKTFSTAAASTPAVDGGIDFSRMGLLMVLLPSAGLLLILALLPLGADMQYSKAERAWATGNIEAAKPSYKNATRINPMRDKYIGQYGQRLVASGSTSGNPATVNAGMELLARAWEKNKYEATYPLALGVASLKLQGSDPQFVSRARYYLKEALRLAPNDARIHYYLAITILIEGRNPKDAAPALAPLRKATIIAPDYFDAQKALGRVNVLLGNEAAAVAAFRAADRLRPNDPEVTKGLKSLTGQSDKSSNTTGKGQK